MALATILNAKHGAFSALCAIVCSSWTTINMGTSGRHVTTPLGWEHLPYVAAANRMASRSMDGKQFKTLCFFLIVSSWKNTKTSALRKQLPPFPPLLGLLLIRGPGWHFASSWSKQWVESGWWSNQAFRCFVSILVWWTYLSVVKKPGSISKLKWWCNKFSVKSVWVWHPLISYLSLCWCDEIWNSPTPFYIRWKYIFDTFWSLHGWSKQETLQLCFIDRPALTLHPKTINGM